MKNELKNNPKDKKYIKIFLLSVAILIAVKILFNFESLTGIFSYIMGIINPFFFGFVIAYCINIPVSWLEKKINKIKWRWIRKASRPISIIVNLLVLLGTIAFGLINIIPMIYDNARQLIAEMPGYIDAGIKAVKQLPLTDELGIAARLSEIDILSVWNSFMPEADAVTQMATGFFSGLFTAFLTVVATVYFLFEYNKVKEFIKRLIRAHNPKRQRPALKYIRLIDSSFRKFLTCQFLDSLILGTMTMIGFTVMGSQYAVTLGLLLGAMNIIPYFGSIVGSVIAVFIIWATSGLDTAIVVAIMLLVMQQIDGNFINPKIMGTSFKISPVLIIIAITIGGAIGGVIGMIFSIPVVNVLKTVLEEYIQTKEDLRVRLGQSQQHEDSVTAESDVPEAPEPTNEKHEKQSKKEKKNEKHK
jgi:predicted PurR-regulated permease PerM